MSSSELGGTRSTSNDTPTKSLPQNETEVKEVFSADDSGSVTDIETAMQEMVEKLRNLTPSQMMGDEVQQILAEYIKREDPKPQPVKVRGYRGRFA